MKSHELLLASSPGSSGSTKLNPENLGTRPRLELLHVNCTLLVAKYYRPNQSLIQFFFFFLPLHSAHCASTLGQGQADIKCALYASTLVTLRGDCPLEKMIVNYYAYSCTYHISALTTRWQLFPDLHSGVCALWSCFRRECSTRNMRIVNTMFCARRKVTVQRSEVDIPKWWLSGWTHRKLDKYLQDKINYGYILWKLNV